jgi:predicted metalloprotease with PDZ domain
LRQASIETWFERYSDYRRPENSVSYYNKGALVSLLLDLGIREATDNRHSLDDVLRLMDKQFGDQNRGFEEADIQRSVETVAETPFEEFFSRYVAGTKELPYEEYFDYAGWTVYEEVAERVKLGFSVDRDDEGFWQVQSLETGTPAGRAGLKEGDQLLKIDQRGFSEEEDLNNLEPGREITLEVQRGPERFVARFVPKTRQEAIVRVSESPAATASQRRIRTGLMTGKP